MIIANTTRGSVIDASVPEAIFVRLQELLETGGCRLVKTNVKTKGFQLSALFRWQEVRFASR